MAASLNIFVPLQANSTCFIKIFIFLSTIHLDWMEGEGGRFARSWCVIWTEVICYQHEADSISARSKSNVRTAREQSLHGAGNFLARHREAVPVLGIGSSQHGNRAFPRWEWCAWSMERACFHGKSTMFMCWKYAIFSQKKVFFCNYPLNFN